MLPVRERQHAPSPPPTLITPHSTSLRTPNDPHTSEPAPSPLPTRSPKCVFVDGATNTTNCALNGYEPDGAAWYDAAGALIADGHAVVGALRVMWAMPAKELLPFISTATGDFGATDWCDTRR